MIQTEHQSNHEIADDKGPTMKLTGPQSQQFSEALRDAFDRQSLAEMLWFNLSKDLAAISLAGNLREIVFDLMRKADQEGWTDQLIDAARKYNPGNPLLRAFAEQLPPVTGATPEKTDVGSTGVAQDDELIALREIIRANKRRLGVLELQAAKYGINTPPEVTIEIEDLKRELRKREQRLRSLGGA
jgi:hypothetical protein